MPTPLCLNYIPAAQAKDVTLVWTTSDIQKGQELLNINKYNSFLSVCTNGAGQLKLNNRSNSEMPLEGAMHEHLNKIFAARTSPDVCQTLQSALENSGYLDSLSDFYEDIGASSPEEIQDWFDDMKDDPDTKKEGALKEVYDLFSAALSRLRDLGFHRSS